MRLRTILSILAINILAVQVTAQSSSQIRDSNRARALALWEEVIKAKGGRDRLHSIESFLISSTIDVDAPRGGGRTETERLYVLPGKAWLYELTPHFDVSLAATVINHERNICFVTLAPANADVPGLTRCLPTTWAARLIQDPIIYLLETKWVQPNVQRTRVEKSGWKKVDVIETEVGPLHVDFYLDRKTRLPYKLVTNRYKGIPELTNRMDLTVKLGDYVNVNGIQMPRKVIREPEVHPSILRRDSEYARYRLNVDYDPSIFDAPIPRTTKANSWKPKNEPVRARH